jgi:hexosaminidase
MTVPPPPDPDSSLLFPRPQRRRELGGHVSLTGRVQIEAPPDLDLFELPSLAWLSRALEARGQRLGPASAGGADPGPVMRLEPLDLAGLAPASSAAATQGYALRIADGVISVGYPSAAGLQYALATLAQLVTLAEGAPGQVSLPALEIEDWPDFEQRGVMLDISRDKVPTLSTLRSLVDQLARWKINQLQLYMEHTFAYPGHDVVWKDASPLTAADVRQLDAHCAARHIELVPNQNSFGHMHRWLVHEPYRALAECPDGFEHPWNWTSEPYGLCATDPASLTFLEGLYDGLLPHFESRRFNVGLDETIDLGHGRSRAACEARGTERVYLEFLKAVNARVRARGKVMQFWGDIIVKRPDLLAELPREAIALEWGYEADHPFAEHLALFARAGLEFQVCPGTSSWNSIAGRTDNAVENIARAAREGKAAGASGLLVTDWGDHGHLQPLAVSYLGLFTAAGFSWNCADAQQPRALDLPRRLDRHVFFDSAGVLGRAAFDLGNAYQHAGSLRPNASVLFWILIKPERAFTPPGVTPESLARTLGYLERAGEALPRARPGTLGLAAAGDDAEGQRVVTELGWARDLLCFACRLGIALGSLPDPSAHAPTPERLAAPVRQALGRELRELIERQQSVWLARNREGGLGDSTRRLSKLLAALEPERR